MIELIRIDSREPSSVVHAIKTANPLLPYVVEELEAGDVRVELVDHDAPPILFERKTVPDLMASIKDRRLGNQITECLSVTPHTFLIVEGNMTHSDDGHTKWRRDLGVNFDYSETGFMYSAVWGVLTKVQTMGAFVRFYRAEDLWQTIYSCAKMITADEVVVMPRQSPQFKDATPSERVLMSFDGVSYTRAKTLLEETGNAANAIWYLSTPLDKTWHVNGIGPVTRQKALDALGMSLMPFNMTEDHDDRTE
jgi:ERCC4-type nuclease